MKKLFFILAVFCAACVRPVEEPSPKVQGKKANGQKKPQTTEELYAPLQNFNKLPVVKSAQFQVISGDSLSVTAEGEDMDGDSVELRYEWFVNNEKRSAGPSISGLKKEDRVLVKITPSDGKQDGPPKTLFMVIRNLPPVIKPTEPPKFEDPVWSYQVNASDPEGDPLTFELVKGPEGMTINPENGFVFWNTEKAPDGKYSALVAVKDSHGGVTQYPFEIEIGTNKP